MVETNLSHRLSSQDASFLYFEKPEAPVHIGSIAVFEGRVPFDRFVDNVASKLHLIPRYRQRVIPAPFNLSHPTWEFDPTFDISRHIHRVRIPPPGNDAQLIELSARLFSGMLDRNKPLWEIYLVEGLQGPRTAAVSKVHHALVDGVSGIGLLMVTLDISPNPPPPPPAEPYQPPPIPNPASRLYSALWDNFSASIDRWAEFQKALQPDRARAVYRALRTALPYVTSPVQRSPFNKPFGGERRVACSEFPFAEVRAMRGPTQSTVNDVVLSILGGAMTRYLEMHGQPTNGRTLRVMVPVNVRREEEQDAMGNRISMLLVEVPLGGFAPLERLRAVTARTASLKEERVAEGVGLMNDLLSVAPAAFQAMLGGLPAPPNTMTNMVCTNVPGPMIPLYTVGHRMLAHYPLIPILWEMGISCGVTSYDQKLYFGLMADADCGADVSRLKAFLDESYQELRIATGVEETEIVSIGTPPPLPRPPSARTSVTPAGTPAAGGPS